MQDKELRPNRKDGFNFLTLVLSGHAATLQPWLRRGQGREAYGFRGIAGLVLLLLFAFTGNPCMGWYLGLWLVALLFRRAESVALRNKGWVCHSMSTGRPVISDILRCSEKTARTLEPLLCALIGIVLAVIAEDQLYPPLSMLAAYIGFGLVSLTFEEVMCAAVIERRAQAMMDAKMEQDAVMQRFKELQ